MIDLLSIAQCYEAKLSKIAAHTVEQDNALKALNKLKKSSDGVDVYHNLPADYNSPWEMFLSKISDRLDYHEYIEQLFMLAPTGTFNINDLIASQAQVEKRLVAKLIVHGSPVLPRLCIYHSKIYIVDGHHRIVAQKLLQKSTIQAKYLELEKLGLE